MTRSFELVFGTLLRVEDLLIVKFVLELLVRQFELKSLCHYLPDDSHVSLPFLLSVLNMVLKEVFIWLKNGKLLHVRKSKWLTHDEEDL